MKLKMKDKTNSICFVLVIEIYILNSPCFSFKQMKFANPDVFREFPLKSTSKKILILWEQLASHVATL